MPFTEMFNAPCSASSATTSLQHDADSTLLRHDDGVNHMNDAVAALDVSLDDLRVAHMHAVLVTHDEGLAVDRFDMRAVLEFEHIGGHDFARNDVVGQDGGQTLLCSPA